MNDQNEGHGLRDPAHLFPHVHQIQLTHSSLRNLTELR